jgi:hypothetical protein
MKKGFEGKVELIKADCVMVDIEDKVKRGYHGVAYTHIQLIKDAKARGDKTLLVFEDDCALIDKTSWGKWLRLKQWCDNNMEHWEIFNPGAILYNRVDDVIRFDEMFLCKIWGGGTCHFIYFNVDAAYQKVLDWEIEKIDIDVYYTTKFNCWVSYPILAMQRDGQSDIQNMDRSWWGHVGLTQRRGLEMIGEYLMKY